MIKYLTNEGCSICQENALRIKKSLGIQRGKSDKIDARRILEYSIRNVDKLHIWEESKPNILVLKDLLAMRERFRKIEWMLKVPVKEKANYMTKRYVTFLHKLHKGALQQVEESVPTIENEIRSLIERDPDLKQKSKLITSIPGIKLVTAAHLICMTRGFTSFSTGRQLACYAGCVPFPHSSGSSVKGKSKISQVANKKLKALIHLVALQGIRKKGEFRKYYDRKVKEGKPKMSVINAIRNKILLRVAAVVKRGLPYMTAKEYKKYCQQNGQEKIKTKNVSKLRPNS